MSVSNNVPKEPPARAAKRRKSRSVGRESVRSAILRSLGRSPRRPGEPIEHRLTLRLQTWAW